MLRRLPSVLLLSLIALPVQAAADKYNQLTPHEIAEGWILLFDGESTFGWTAPNDSQWTVFQGMLAPQAGKEGLLVTTTAFADYELTFEYRRKSDTDPKLRIRCDAQGQVSKEADILEIPHYSNDWWEFHITVRGNKPVPYPNINRPRSTNTTFGFVASKVASDGADKPAELPKPKGGHIALSGNGIIFRNIKLRPLNTQPLFNGKDLSGWKVFPNRKSQFTVTPDGALNVKNGPGDLQSEGQWADFVLQLECISNGQHLNSGVFFRCLPDQYQQGYEAQIRNQFTPEPTQAYTIEVYDPKTHELKDKQVIKSPAVDYGTGAIYRRMPARRAVAQDGEWFTLTVVAQGRHFATWVNGVPVVDWTDHRPLADNARQGCYLKKGPISFQGHDPTTDLSFRNIRIADLAPDAKAEPKE
ncbi:MAG: DUF1080 domain-containing protein [Gemmataceae bacterium]